MRIALMLRVGFIGSLMGLAAMGAMINTGLDAGGRGGRVAYAAGPVDIELHGGGGFEVIMLGTDCSNNLYPGLACTDVLVIRNAGNLDFAYTIEAWSDTNSIDDGPGGFSGDTPSDCVNVHLEQPIADGSGVGDASTFGPLFGGQLAAGETQTWGLEVSVDDDDACQGQAATIFARVVASGDLPPEQEEPGDGGSSPAGPGPSAPEGNPPAPGSDPALPPASPLVPPPSGDAGLIGGRPQQGGLNPWLAGVSFTLMLLALASFAATRRLERRGHR